ncbi:MAG: hypothetical protein QQN41_08060 [Nitrosopumilus sp.]
MIEKQFFRNGDLEDRITQYPELASCVLTRHRSNSKKSGADHLKRKRICEYCGLWFAGKRF